MYRRPKGPMPAPSSSGAVNPPATALQGPPPGPTTTASGAASAACTPCRAVKMKCTREPNETVCNRCKRKSLHCFYETHRRGRKPGTKLRPKAERDREREERERQKAKDRAKQEAVPGEAGLPQSVHGVPSSLSQYSPGYSGNGNNLSSATPRHLPSTSTASSDLASIPSMQQEPSGMKRKVASMQEDEAYNQMNPLAQVKSESTTSVDAHSTGRLSGSAVHDPSHMPNGGHPQHSAASGSGRSTPAASARSLGKTDGLAPFRLLRKSATAGNFTIANILNAEEESDSSSGNEKNNGDGTAGYGPYGGIGELKLDEANDPILKGLVNLPTAQGLFESFFQYMNPFICQFDPRLHTMKYIRIKSSFLFSALLSAAAKFFSPDHYQTLYDHVENQLKEIMCAGKKSAEIVQGICLMTYWKQPSDSRAWLLVGYAIRACIEMGWHQLRPTNLEPDMMVLQPERETELRERRNKERMWLLLFVYDRSVSLQVGKPWMIQMDALIRSSDTWHQHAYAVPGTDQVMSAFVQLRVLGSELLDKFCVDFQACSPEVLQKNEVILKLFNGDLDRWEGKWYRAVEEASANISHRFLIHFYGTHLRLLLNSYRLQLSILSNGSISKEALWVCYTSALDMLRLVVDRLGVGSHLFYCQDSVHAMVAYATTVVIKILLTLPRELPPDAESKVLGLINETSEAFRRQRPASNTSCFHQYLFLANIAKQYQKSKRESMENEEEWIRRMSTARSSSDNNYDANSYTTDNTGGSSVNRMSTTMAAAAGLLNLDRRVSTISGSFPMMPPPPRLSMSRRSTQISPLSENGPGAAFYSSLSPPATASSNAGPLDQQSYPPHGYPQPGPPQGLPQQLSYPPPQSMPGMQMGTLPQQGPQLYPSSANPNEQGYPASTGYISGTMATGIGAGPNAAYPLFADNVVWEDLFANAGFSVNSGAFLPTNLTDA